MEKYIWAEWVACVLKTGDIKNSLFVLLQEHPEWKKRPRKNPLQYTVLAWTKEKDESAKDCIIREVKEEAGLDIKNPKYIGKFWLDIGSETQNIILPVKVFEKQLKLSKDFIIRPEFDSEISGWVLESIEQILEKPLVDIRPWTLEALYLSLGWKFESLYLVKIEWGNYTSSQFQYMKKLIEKQLWLILKSVDLW